MQIPATEASNLNGTWIGGPTHQLQKQHIPGYVGHVDGLKAENLFGQPYSKLTGDCLHKRIERGFIIDETKRLKTTYMGSFHKHGYPDSKDTLALTANAILNTQNMAVLAPPSPEKTYEEVINEELEPIDRLPVVGYQGYKPVYRNPVRKTKAELPRDLLTSTQAAFTQTSSPLLATQTTYTGQIIPASHVPVVGYTGFVEGKKAQNVYGTSFKNVIVGSKAKAFY